MPVYSAARIKQITDEYVAWCLAHQEVPEVKELAAKLGMSAADFSKLFLKLLGEHPSEYLKRSQIECVKRLLRETDLHNNEIAYRCGFRRRTTFYRLFKQHVGMTPQQYRARYRRRR